MLRAISQCGRCLIWFAICYAACRAAWPLIKPTYASAFRTVSQTLLGSLGSGTTVRYEGPSTPSAAHDVEVEVVAWGHKRKYRGFVDSRSLAFLPTIVLLSLIVATPIPWASRARALAWAVPLIHAYIGLRLLVTLSVWNTPKGIESVFDVGPTALAALRAVHGVFSVSMAGIYLGPIFIWIALAFRSDVRARAVAAIIGGPVRSRASA